MNENILMVTCVCLFNQANDHCNIGCVNGELVNGGVKNIREKNNRNLK